MSHAMFDQIDHADEVGRVSLETKDLTFGSPEELAAMLEEIGLRLHSKNRMGGGESGFLWLLAETIRKTGRLALRTGDRSELDALYGDGYKAGTIPDEDQMEHFMALLKEQPTDT
jgi:hypothetical protein